MDARELLATLEENPNDFQAFETAVADAIEDGGYDGLDLFLTEVVSSLTVGPLADAVLKFLDQQFRKYREGELVPILAWSAGLVAWRINNDFVRAEFFMRAVGAGSPHDEDWRDFYRAFYAGRGNWLKLEQFMAESAERLGMSEAESKRILARTAAEFENPSKELSYWQAVANAEPSDDEAERELEKLFTRLERWPSLAELLKGRFDKLGAGDIDGKVAILKGMLAIYGGKMKAEPKVLATYQMILDIDPSNVQAIDALLERYSAQGRWPDYAKTLQRKIDQAQDPDERLVLMEHRAELMETRFANPLEALKAYEQILELAPNRKDVIEKLKDLYEKRRDYESLIRLRRIEADGLDDPSEKKAIFTELAITATDRLRKFPVAIEIWELVLAIDPADMVALENLDGLYERTKDVDKQCEVMRRRIELTNSDTDRIQTLEKLAGIYGTKVKDADGAMDTWRQILDFDPEHDRAKRELRTRYLAEHKWEGLEWFLRKYGTVEELARTLESQIAGVSEQAEKRNLLYKLASLWRDEVGQGHRAVKDLEAVLAIDDGDLRAASELISLYRELSDWRKLPRVYDIAISKISESGEKRRLMIEAAQVHEQYLSNLEKAFFWYVEVFKDDMLDDDIQGELERLAGPSGNWDIYVAVMSQSAELMDDPYRKIATYLRIGQIQQSELKEPESAQAAFRQALDLDPENREAISALEGLYRELGRNEDLIDVLRKRLALGLPGDDHLGGLLDIARILYGNLGRIDDAIEVYRDSLAQAPSDRRVYDELGDIFLKERRFEELRALLNDLVHVLAGDPDTDVGAMADVHCRIGLLTAGIEGPCAGVVESFAQALDFLPEHELTLSNLEDLLGVEELRSDIIDLLKGPFERLGRMADLADLLEMELSIKGDNIDTQDILWRLDGLFSSQVDDPKRRFNTLCRIFMLTPDKQRAWDSLEDVAESVNGWVHLADIYSENSAQIADSATRVSLLIRLAAIRRERLDSVETAMTVYHDVLSIDSQNEDALEALEGIYEESANYPELHKIYRRRFEVSPYVGEKIAYAFKVASVQADHLGDVEGAITSVKKVLDLDPEFAQAYRQLDTLYIKAERWFDLATVLEDRIRLAETDSEKVYLRLRLAETLETKIEDIAGAVDVYRIILEGDSQSAEAVGELERLFANDDVKVAIASILLPTYEQRGDWTKLVEVYNVLGNAEQDVNVRIRHIETISAIQEDRIGDVDSAFAMRAKAFDIAPEREDLIKQVLRIGKDHDRIEESVFVLAAKVFDIGDDVRRKETHRIIASVCRNSNLDREMAKRHFNEILTINGTDMAAIDALVDLRDEDGETEQLVALLMRKADLTIDNGERSTLLIWAGELYSGTLKQPAEAISAFTGVLELDPGNIKAITALSALYEKGEHWEELVDILGAKADNAPDDDARVKALKRKGLVQHERMGNTAEAIETFLQVLAINDGDVDCLRTLDKFYGAVEDWWIQYSNLEKLFALVSGNEKQVVRRRMGGLLEGELGDPTKAVEVYEEILIEFEDVGDVINALEGMVRSGNAAEDAFRILAPTLSERLEWERLYIVYDIITGQEQDLARRVANLLTMGSMAEDHMQEPIRAFDCYGRAFTTDPLNSEARGRIESLATSFDMWDNVPLLLLEGAENIEGTPEALQLRSRAGEILRDGLDDLSGSAEVFEGIADDYPENLSALNALDSIYLGQEKWEELARILRLEVDAVVVPAEKISYLLRLADVEDRRLGKTKTALDSFSEILYLEANHPLAVTGLRQMFDRNLHKAEILEIIEPIYRNTAAWMDLAAIYEAVLGVLEDPDDKKNATLKLAEVWEHQLDDKNRALFWYGKALEIDPGDESLLTQIEMIVNEINAFDDYKDIVLASANAVENGERKVYLWHKAMDTARDRLNEIDLAEAIARWILGVMGDDQKALAILDTMYVSQERWADLLDILEQEVEAAQFDDERIGFQLRIGELQRDRLNDLDGAVEAYRKVVTADEMHRLALSALAELHEVREEYQDLYRVLGTLADSANTGAERTGLQRQMAVIAEKHLDLKEDALNLWEEISRFEPNDADSLHQLQRLFAEKEDWTLLVDACERELPLVDGNTSRTVELLRRIADAAENQLGDAYQAQAALRRILDRSPQDVDALMALRRLYRESGDLDGLAGVLTSLADLDTFERAFTSELVFELASLLTDELPRLDSAITWWNRYLNIAPDSVPALEALERVYTDTGRYADAVEIIKRRAHLVEDNPESVVELLVRASEIESDQMKDLRSSSRTLEIVAKLSAGNLDVSERLQSIYTRLEDWDGFANVLLLRDSMLDSVDARVTNLMDLARVFESKKADSESAFFTMIKAAQVNPKDDSPLLESWRLAQDTGNWEIYVQSLTEVADSMLEETRLEHLLRFGEILLNNVGDPESSIKHFTTALELSEENETALVALTGIYDSLGRFEELVSILERRVEVTPDYLEKIQFQFRIGELLEGNLHNDEGALKAYAKVLGDDETHIPTIRAMLKLNEKLGLWEGMLSNIDMLAPLVPEEEVALRLVSAKIVDEKIEDSDRAINAYEVVLELDPSHSDAIDRLQALYGNTANWKGLADVFERLLDMASEDPDRILYCNRLAVLYEEALEDKEHALEYWRRILDIDNADDEAFETCFRLLSEVEDYNELVNLLEAHVMVTPSSASKVATLRRIAEVYETKMDDPNSAVTVVSRIVDIAPDDVHAYSELVRLHTNMSAWDEVVETYLRWKEHAENDEQFVEYMMASAKILDEEIENPDRAVDMLRNILAVQPLNQKASNEIMRIYGRMEEWDKVADLYIELEGYARTDEERASFQSLAAAVYSDKLKDRTRAIHHYERALELDPRLHDVALSLGRSYVANEQWEKAEPLLDMLLSSDEVMADHGRASEIHFQLGMCGEKLLDFERAFREYQAAMKIRPDHVQTALGLGRLYQRKQLWQLAKDHFLKGFEGGGELPDEYRAEIAFSLGEISLELGELDLAVKFLDKVLELASDHERAVELQVAIAEKRGDWPAVIKYKQRKAMARQDPYEQFAIQLEIGDIYREKIRNVHGATAAYKEALDINPGAKVALLRLFELYLETGAVDDALFTLESLAQAEDSPEKRARQYARMAALYQEKLGDDTRAIDYLNMALDADPEFLEAFRAVDELLTQRRDWAAQAESYRKMLERLKGRQMAELEYRLYANLGEIYRSRLKQIDYAIQAYAMAAEIRPQERKTHEILAQLYQYSGDQVDRAIEEHRTIVTIDPLGTESAASYKAMRKLFLETKELDKAFITASVLQALGFADDEETSFFQSNLDPELPWFKGTIDPLRWESHLMSKDVNTVLGRLLQVLFQGLGAELGVKDLRDIGLKKKSELDLEQKLLFVNVYKAVAKALGPLPHKVYRDENPTGLSIAFLSPPAFVVGSDMLTGHDQRDIAFRIGRQLTFLHPMNFLVSVKNMTELKVFVAAMLKFSRPETQVTVGAEVVMELVKLIDRRMPQQLKNQMHKLVADLYGQTGALDVQALFENFFKATERTSLRAGTLVSGNIPDIVNILKVEDFSFSGMSSRERLAEVIRFAMSEDHFILRRALGIAVEEA